MTEFAIEASATVENAPTRYLVVRTSDKTRPVLWDELRAGRLRQGWGISNTQLTEGGRAVPRVTWCQRFVAAAAASWEGVDDGVALSRWRILAPLASVNPGDRIIVPKMPDAEHFTVATVSQGYAFDQRPAAERGPLEDDFRHIIAIDQSSVRTFPYAGTLETRAVLRAMRAYQGAVNRVWNDTFITAIETLLQRQGLVEAQTSQGIFNDARASVLGDLLARFNAMTFRDIEDMVALIFKAQGYEVVERNQYDRKGGDVDLVLNLDLPLIGDFADRPLTVHVQVKKKTGKLDPNDRVGVEQLVRMAAGRQNVTSVLVSTAEEFTPECREYAAATSTTLISGRQLADLMLRHL